jgi:hypothetical protein
VLRTLTSPPIMPASIRTIDSPSPVPPWRRAALESACSKGSNTFCAVISSMPTPLSRIRMRTLHVVALSGSTSSTSRM